MVFHSEWGQLREARRRLRSTKRIVVRAPRALVRGSGPRLDKIHPGRQGRHELPNKRLQLPGARVGAALALEVPARGGS